MARRAVFVVASLASLVGCKASSGCACLSYDGTPQTSSSVADASFVTAESPQYGYGCKQHDVGKGSCSGALANVTADGQPHDWCLDYWCIVDPNSCDLKTRAVTFTAKADDYFAYEACDSNEDATNNNGPNFAGNGWIGRCLNCDGYHHSFCDCGGQASCKCLAGSTQQVAAAGKPAYVGTVPSYGYGCMAHDKGQGDCATANDTADGEPNDWCLDQWCQVDKDSCDFKTRATTYTANTNDYFSFETCDSNFAGNGWVGRCACADKANSYCECTGGAADSVNLASGTGLSELAVCFLALGMFV